MSREDLHIHGAGYTSNDSFNTAVAEQGSVKFDFTMYGLSCHEHTLRNVQGDAYTASSHDELVGRDQGQ